uniref:Histone-lysine N-methyltransferase, H3 lysine-9 specific SUVH5 n=1 Tax=Anthurium amnicola TaxID=1678845 RepID=A0A1D1XSB8_9ARAE
MTRSLSSRRGVPDENGVNVYHACCHWFAYALSFPDGCGYYASPLEPTGPRSWNEVLHDVGNPILDDTRMVKSIDESKLAEEPSSVAGYYSDEDEEETLYLLKCLDGTGQPESSETSDEFKLAIALPKQLKAQKFDDAQMLNSSNELKLSLLPSIMAQNEVLSDPCMDPLICPDSTSSLQPQNSLNNLEQITRNSSKMILCHSAHSIEDGFATVPCKSSAASTTKRVPGGPYLQSPALGHQEIVKIRAGAQGGTASNSKVIETGNSTSTKTVGDLGNPTVDDMKLVKYFGVPNLVEAPSNVAGKSSEEMDIILFKYPEGAGNPESLEPSNFHETAKWNTSDVLKQAMGPSKRLKTPKFDNTQTFSSFNELKLSASSGVMAKNEGFRDSYMDPLEHPDPTNSFQSGRQFRSDTVDQVSRNSSKIMERHSLDSRVNVVDIVPYESSAATVNTEQAILGAATADARACGKNTTQKRASATRRFPLGCGRQAPAFTRQDIEKFKARAQAGAASNSKVSETGISTCSDRVRDNRPPSRFIAKKSGRETRTLMENFNCIEKSTAQPVKKANVLWERDFPGHRNQVASRARNAATFRNEGGFPNVLPKVSPKHTGKAIVGFVDDPLKHTTAVSRYKGKAVLMFDKHPSHTPGKSTAQPKNEARVECDTKCTPQQSEQCRKLIDYPKSSYENSNARERFKRILHEFQSECRKLLQDKETKTSRPDLKIFGLMKGKGMTPSRKYLGAVPGVVIGDEFHYRGELMVTGLHCSPVAGIDSMLYNGIKVAACIISSGGYTNFVDRTGAFIYSGEGGNPDFERKRKRPPGDQKLVRGNLALKNSRDTQAPVRVIHGLKGPGAGKSLKSGVNTVATYVYDGLYKVERFWPEKGNMGYSIFKFQLRRLPGQPELASRLQSRAGGARLLD